MIKIGYLSLYVDDVILAYHKQKEYQALQVIDQGYEQCAITGGHNLWLFLGAGGLKIGHIEDFIHRRQSTLIGSIDPQNQLAKLSEINMYQRKIGSLICAAITIRSDIYPAAP